MNERIRETMKSCPFCGHEVDMDDPDTLYPNGIGWDAAMAQLDADSSAALGWPGGISDPVLEALKEIVAATDSDEWNPVSTAKARAAIAKATGSAA